MDLPNLYQVLSSIAILQRVASASVSVDTHMVSSIGKGVLVFAAIAADDTRKEVESMAAKVLKMKLWPDETGATVCLNMPARNHHGLRSYLSRSGSRTSRTSRERCFVVGPYDLYELASLMLLAVSQFTLLASTKKGNKPDFHGAAGLDQARELYDHFYAKVQELYDPEKIKNGVFQAMMEGRFLLQSDMLHQLKIWQSISKIQDL